MKLAYTFHVTEQRNGSREIGYVQIARTIILHLDLSVIGGYFCTFFFVTFFVGGVGGF